MNLRQLEMIRKKVEVIKELINQDPDGAYDIEDKLRELEKVVLKEIRAELWRLYEKNAIIVKEEP